MSEHLWEVFMDTGKIEAYIYLKLVEKQKEDKLTQELKQIKQ